MKKKFFNVFCVLITAFVFCAVLFSGCSGGEEPPKTYTVVLDYGGAPVTGSRQFTVTYGESLPELPVDLTLEHKDFKGWFTEENCGGAQIADEYGLIPIVSVVNESNFDLSGTGITLYAGFETTMYNVTCHFRYGVDDEVIKVAYDTPVNKIVTETRVDGFAVLNWSKSQGGDVFRGKITGDTDLYATEYAPVIDFDANGGAAVEPLIARAGAEITLPVPQKELCAFLYWQDGRGNKFEQTVMPMDSVSLEAVWQAKLTFDENGGSEVADISEKAGEDISLPVPEREGYVFAGWYTADKQKYEESKMPSAGVALKAGWYEVKTEKIIIKTSEERTSNPKSICEGQSTGPSAKWRNKIDLSEYIDETGADIKITFNAKMKFDVNAVGKGGFYFYDDILVSESNFLDKYTATVAGTSYNNYNFEMEFTTRSNVLYVCYYASVTQDISGSMWKYLIISDIWVNVSYPDTAKLCL